MKCEIKHCLVSLTEKLSEKLALNQFGGDCTKENLEDNVLLKWTRDFGWKREYVELIYPKKYLDSVKLCVGVYLPCHQEEIMLDGTTVGYLAGRLARYEFPFFFTFKLPWQCRRFVKRAVEDTEKALSWFHNYDTPSSCLRNLQKGETVLGEAKRGGCYEKAETYLKSLI